jgi:hypothetical protein
MNLLSTLRVELKEWRASFVQMSGGDIPASIPFLRGVLSATMDEFERDRILVAIADEYFRVGLNDEVIAVGRERVAASPDTVVVWLSLAIALSEHVGGSTEAREASARGLEIARRRNMLVRHALICQALVAKKINDSALFDSSLSDLIEDAPNVRQDDRGLNFELVDDLPENFGSEILISRYRNLCK